VSFLSVDRVREMLSYDPETGEFRWKVSITNRKAGSIAGRDIGNGYRYIRIDNVDYTAARLAWFYVNGEWPKGKVISLNGDTLDVRIANLHDAAYQSPLKKYDYRTKEGRAAFQKDYRSRHRRRFTDNERQRKFGITPKWFREQFEKQGGVCAICKQPETRTRMGLIHELAVDHNHTTGAVRELLCHACNVLIGYARENPEILRAAVAYLERHNGG
jgi:hypothetical protein